MKKSKQNALMGLVTIVAPWIALYLSIFSRAVPNDLGGFGVLILFFPAALVCFIIGSFFIGRSIRLRKTEQGLPEGRTSPFMYGFVGSIIAVTVTYIFYPGIWVLLAELIGLVFGFGY